MVIGHREANLHSSDFTALMEKNFIYITKILAIKFRELIDFMSRNTPYIYLIDMLSFICGIRKTALHNRFRA